MHESQSLKTPRRRPRLGEDSTLEYMRKNNLPMTRDAYLTRAYGDPDVKLDAEGESMLPEQFRK